MKQQEKKRKTSCCWYPRPWWQKATRKQANKSLQRTGYSFARKLAPLAPAAELKRSAAAHGVCGNLKFMIDKNKARELAQAYIDKLNAGPFWFDEPVECVLIDEATMEEDFGWVFFYDTKRYLETHNRRDGLIGNAPFIINRYDGSLHVTGTAYETEHYINDYRKQLARTD